MGVTEGCGSSSAVSGPCAPAAIRHPRAGSCLAGRGHACPSRLGTAWLCRMGPGRSRGMVFTRSSLQTPMVCQPGVLQLPFTDLKADLGCYSASLVLCSGTESFTG